MAKKNNRFERIYEQSSMTMSETIILDRKTGVNYLLVNSGYGGGLTPLLNRDGTPVVSTLTERYED